MSRSKFLLTALIAAGVLSVGCGEADPSTQPDEAPAAAEGTDASSAKLPAGHPDITTTVPAQAGAALATAAPAATAPVTADITGKVLETMDSAGYSYVLLDTADGQKWAAVPQLAVTVGQELGLTGTTPMTDFHSKTLDRTFDVILFGDVATEAATAVGGAAKASAVAPMPATSAVAPLSGPVAKATAADAQTVAEVYASSAELSGKTVSVSGQVVKFNPAIMGSNWIHIQDGSGKEAGPDNDLAVTTAATVAVGQVVTIQGTLSTDKDFGAGYKYAVIVEDATVDVTAAP